MELLIYLLTVIVLGPPIYQSFYFSRYYTITKFKAFFLGSGYWTILCCLLVFPAMMASESGTVATIIAIILGIALTGWIFYLIIKKRTAKLAELYPNDKFIAVKETIACLGMLFASIFMLLLIFLPFLRRRD